jgi:hypothetical protein
MTMQQQLRNLVLRWEWERLTLTLVVRQVPERKSSLHRLLGGRLGGVNSSSEYLMRTERGRWETGERGDRPIGLVQFCITQGVAASTITERVLGWHWQTRLFTPQEGAAVATALEMQAEAQVGI